MKSAIIGLGVIGKVHYQVLKESGENIVALCDIDAKKLEAYEGVKKYADYKEMLDKEDVDVLHVCTPHYLHAEMVIYALEKGVNVLCEKPLCISREQIDAILNTEKKSVAKLGVCFQNRYNNSSMFAKHYLEDKDILWAFGSVRWHRDAAYYASADWRGKWATEGGGVLINQAIHTLDLLGWIAGEPTKCVGGTFNRSLKGIIEVEDTACVDFVGKCDFTLFATNTSPKDMPIELRFLTKNEIVSVTPDQVFINGKPVDISKDFGWYGKASYGNGHEKLIRDFYDTIARGENFWIDGKEGAKAVRQVLAAYESKGDPVTI